MRRALFLCAVLLTTASALRADEAAGSSRRTALDGTPMPREWARQVCIHSFAGFLPSFRLSSLGDAKLLILIIQSAPYPILFVQSFRSCIAMLEARHAS